MMPSKFNNILFLTALWLTTSCGSLQNTSKNQINISIDYITDVKEIVSTHQYEKHFIDLEVGPTYGFLFDAPKVTLKKTWSASGERFENKELRLVFWRKGKKMFLLKNDSIIARGKEYKHPKNEGT